MDAVAPPAQSSGLRAPGSKKCRSFDFALRAKLRRTKSGVFEGGRLVAFFEVESKFFDHRIGEDFTRDTLNLCPGSGGVELVAELQHEVFSLADIFDSLVLHLL